jgi:predicted FMN-binding regulatory protein PaiB
MYTSPKIQPDRATALSFAQARGFATVCAFDGGKPVASALPFCLDYASDGARLFMWRAAMRWRRLPTVNRIGCSQ